jgi:hypothetical protein
VSLTREDIRASVAAGEITEAQAANILALSDARRGVRENIDGLDEPFELFKGFNEIFIVIGLSILFVGWTGITNIGAITSDTVSIYTSLYGVIGMILIYLLTQYFTLKRRMIAPSIALSIMFAISSLQVGFGLKSSYSMIGLPIGTLCSMLTAICVLFYWIKFRIPFALFLIALSTFTSTFGLIGLGRTPSDAYQMLLLSGTGPFSYLTTVLGLIALAIALRFDMSDPHRVTRRSQNGFWLHIIAAPAIVNTIALTLFQSSAPLALTGLLMFLGTISILAIVIDRRSFLISGIGYIVALASASQTASTFVIILILGVCLVFLGARWTDIRRAIMTALPDFTGKNRLPPYAKDAT